MTAKTMPTCLLFAAQALALVDDSRVEWRELI